MLMITGHELTKKCGRLLCKGWLPNSVCLMWAWLSFANVVKFPSRLAGTGLVFNLDESRGKHHYQFSYGDIVAGVRVPTNAETTAGRTGNRPVTDQPRSRTDS